MNRPGRVAIAGALTGGVGVAAFALARANPGAVETLYSQGIYPWIARMLAGASGTLPISLFEIVYGLLLALLAGLPVSAYLWSRRRHGAGRGRALGAAGASLLALGGGAWLVFLLAWGFNYAREPVDRTFGLGPQPDSTQARRWISTIGRRLDRLRAELDEDERGVVRAPQDLDVLDREIARLQAQVLGSRGLPAIRAGRTKRLASSPLLLRWRLSGMYGPFTGEPNVVLPAAPGLLPFTVAHERAHLAGIAQEDAASYVALMTLWASEDPRLRYAAWLELWLHLHRSPRGRHPGVVRDVQAVYEFSRRHGGWEQPVIRRAYDAYLKTHGVEGGTRSYGRVADLALRHLERFGIPDLPTSLRSRGEASGLREGVP